MSNSSLLNSLKLLTQPYLFVLKEDQDIDENPMSYTLLMLKIGPTEYIHSPKLAAPIKINPKLKPTLPTLSQV